MGIMLSKDTVSDMDSCFHREILTYVRYHHEGSKRCFAYPQFLFEDGTLAPLAKSAFPDDGCLPMVMDGTDGDELEELYGNIVIMVVNDESPRLNRNYPETESAQFNSIINPHYQKGRSAIEFRALSKHRLSFELMQVLEVQEGNVDFSKPLENPLHLYGGDAAPRTNLALVSQTLGAKRRYFGPFECSCEGDMMKIAASSNFNMLVAEFDAASFDFTVDVANDLGEVITRFVSAAEFAEKFEDIDDATDWIGDSELLDAIGRISRAMDEPFTKGQMRNLKAALACCSEVDAKIQMDDGRRQKMLSLIGTYEDWGSLPGEVQKGAIENADPAQLADYVFNDENFVAFYDKVLEVDQIRDQIEQEKARYQKQVEAAKKDAEAAKRKKLDAQRDLESYEKERDAKREQLEEEIAETIETARRNRDKLEARIAQLAADKEKLETDKAALEQQIARTIKTMSDEALVSGKILESAMIGQIVSTLGDRQADGQGEDDGKQAPSASNAPIRADEDELTDEQVVDQLVNLVCERGGRDLSRNEVVNLMICLSQGYILTLAGLPGTGKTSLASILAGSLGLACPTSARFAEVSVERGWTSYKDFVGYYNPLTGTMEKSNATVFDAFNMLDDEVGRQLEAGQLAPYIVLLDEANLSSIEHYWSPFLRACDSFRRRPTDLSLGGGNKLLLPSYLRFIATVNFDHTTEELSPRFLDRSWTITLDPDAFDFDGEGLDFSSPDYADVPAFSVAKLRSIFGPKPEATAKSSLRAKLKEVLDTCAVNKCPASPRSQRMIWNYICTADGLMEQSTAQTSYAPVDYAVSQKILPLLAGTEEKTERLLCDLSGIDKLPVTKSRVDHMIEAGNASGYYQYFA